MIAECPHCEADIPIDASQEGNVLTCPSCGQQCAFERPALPPAPSGPGQAAGSSPRQAITTPVLDRPYHPAGGLLAALLLFGAFVAGAVTLEPWLSENPSAAGHLKPVGRFFIVALHFPLVLVTVLFFSEILLALRRRALFRTGMRYLLWWAFLTSALSWFLGTMLTRDPSLAVEEPAASTLELFALASTGVLFVTLFVKILTDARPGRSPALYRVLVLASTSIVLCTGYLGLGLVVGDAYLFPPDQTDEKSAAPDAREPPPPQAQ